MLRSPKATETQSKVSAGKGSFSASQSASGGEMPWSISLSRPTSSIAALISVIHTCPEGPTRRANAAARSPLPEATSSTLEPSRTPESSIAKRFQSRCRPSDIRSFMRS